MQDRALLQQAREEYLQELRSDAAETYQAFLRRDTNRIWRFVVRYPGLVGAGVLTSLPVLLILRSPQVAGMLLSRLVASQGLLSKLWLSAWMAWFTALGLDIPGKIWNARVRAAKRFLQRRREAQESNEGTGESWLEKNSLFPMFC